MLVVVLALVGVVCVVSVVSEVAVVGVVSVVSLICVLNKPHVTHGSVGINICGDKWEVAKRTSRKRFKYRGVINVFNPISPVPTQIVD